MKKKKVKKRRRRREEGKKKLREEEVERKKKKNSLPRLNVSKNVPKHNPQGKGEKRVCPCNLYK